MSSKLPLQWLGRASRKEYLKAVYCHPAAVHGVAKSDTTKRLNWKYFRAASSDCSGTLSTRDGMAGRYNCSESGTARDWYFTSHLCISRSNGCSTLFRGWGLSEVTKLINSQNSEAVWGRGYKLGKAREWWQNASFLNWGSQTPARSNETRPRVTATLQLRGPITHPQGQPPARTFFLPSFPAAQISTKKRNWVWQKKKSQSGNRLSHDRRARRTWGALVRPGPAPLTPSQWPRPLRRGVEHEAPPPNGLPSEGQSGQ